MVGLLEGAMTVLGHAGAGGFRAMGENASERMINAEWMRRQENLARLQDQYAQKAERRQLEHSKQLETHRGGLLTAESDRQHKRDIKTRAQEFEQNLRRSLETAKTAKQIEDSAKIPLQKTFEFLVDELGMSEDDATAAVLGTLKQSGSKADLDKRKLYETVFSNTMETLLANAINPDEAQMKEAERKARRYAAEISGWEPEGSKAGGLLEDDGQDDFTRRLGASNQRNLRDLLFPKPKPTPKKSQHAPLEPVPVLDKKSH